VAKDARSRVIANTRARRHGATYRRQGGDSNHPQWFLIQCNRPARRRVPSKGSLRAIRRAAQQRKSKHGDCDCCETQGRASYGHRCADELRGSPNSMGGRSSSLSTCRLRGRWPSFRFRRLMKTMRE
jgi:hypothetical protein